MGLNIYELVLEVEEEFGIKIPNADMRRIESVGDLFDVTVKNLREQQTERFAGSPLYEDEVWVRLKALLVEQLALKPEQVAKPARFFDELGFA